MWSRTYNFRRVKMTPPLEGVTSTLRQSLFGTPISHCPHGGWGGCPLWNPTLENDHKCERMAKKKSGAFGVGSLQCVCLLPTSPRGREVGNIWVYRPELVANPNLPVFFIPFIYDKSELSHSSFPHILWLHVKTHSFCNWLQKPSQGVAVNKASKRGPYSGRTRGASHFWANRVLFLSILGGNSYFPEVKPGGIKTSHHASEG